MRIEGKWEVWRRRSRRKGRGLRRIRSRMMMRMCRRGVKRRRGS